MHTISKKRKQGLDDWSDPSSHMVSVEFMT